MIRTWLAVGAVAAVAIVAAADALRDRPEPPKPPPREPVTEAAPDLEGADVPPPGALAGTLYLASADGCRIRALDLGELRLGPEGDETACGLWASPGGQFAVVSEGPVARLALVVLGGKPVRLRELGGLVGEPSWSADGRSVAWCGPAGHSWLLRLRRVEPEPRPGCAPQIAADGSLLTQGGRSELLRDGDVLYGPAELERGFAQAAGGVLDVLAFDERSDGVVAVAVSRLAGGRREAVLQLWRGGTLIRSAALPRGGTAVEFSPTGAEVAVETRGEDGRVAVLDVRSGEVLLPPTPALWLSWSPDGVWLALATPGGIPIYGPGRVAPAYVLPLPAAAVAWR